MVIECCLRHSNVVKLLVRNLAGTKNPTMLRVDVAQGGMPFG